MIINNDITRTIEKIKNHLLHCGLQTECYSIENYSGYSSITGNSTDTVYCIESCMGQSPRDPNLRVYAIAQIFWDKYPNLALVGTICLDSNGQPSGEAQYSQEVDKNFSEVFLPLVYRGFNSLDPTGGLSGQVVQRYTDTRVMLEDFIPAIFYTLRLLLARGLTGQLATIAGDFNDSLTRMIAGMIGPFVKGNDIHLYPTTSIKSEILIPTRNRSNPASPYTLESSTALDKAFTIALQYLKSE